MRDADRQDKIVVIGSGVAGIVSAYLLQRRYDVALLERNDYIGGHTHTITVEDGPDAGTPVDTGFIVFNDRTYPNFRKFLAELDVPYGDSDMSFSYYNPDTGMQYSGRGFKGLFARRGSALSPAHWRFLHGIAVFCRRAQAALDAGELSDLTLGQFCERERFPRSVVEGYVLPMASAIWSSPMRDIGSFPMEPFARFYGNHGLLSLKDRPTWYYVKGGSHQYVKRFLAGFRGEVVKENGAVKVTRGRDGVEVVLADGGKRRFDKAVIAAHADEALAMLADPTEEERELLGAWKYSDNLVYLHTWTDAMPPSPHAWASWNYHHRSGVSVAAPASLTYDMNRLQALDTRNRYFVTLNPQTPIPEDHVLREIHCMHPVYDFPAIRSQERLDSLNENGTTYFCGSYFKFGFHEDAVRSAVAVAHRLGVEF